VTRRLAAIAAWLVAGHALWLALFWGLLQVPESSAWMLALSAALSMALVAGAAAVQSGGSAAWLTEKPFVTALMAGVRRPQAALLPAVVFGLLWWATQFLLEWYAGVKGQIDATYIARTGRSQTQWIHTAFFWIVMFLRWPVGLTLAVSMLAGAVAGGLKVRTSGAWIRTAMAPRVWLAVTFWFVLLVAVPWQLVDWRPRGLSIGMEPWFAGAKLTLVAVAMAVGWALVLRVGHEATEKP